MDKQSKPNQLSRYQKKALDVALFTEVSEIGDDLFTLRMKRLLLRAFVIYQRHQHLSAEASCKHQLNFQKRLKECLELNSDKKTQIPYYLLIFLTEVCPSVSGIEKKHIVEASKTFQATNCHSSPERSKLKILLSYCYRYWLGVIRNCFYIGIKNPQIAKLKNILGCISLIHIKVGGENIKVRNVDIQYHDLYHLEVAQLERIRMGKHLVSGIHGINTAVFHNCEIVEEYDSFFDEARIAIHEGLTRTTPFSILKALCWMIWLILQGINPFAVLMRHIRSMKNKQEELISIFTHIIQ